MINKTDNINKNIFFINYRLFLAILLFTPLYLFKNIYVKLFGGISILLIMILAIFDVVCRMSRIKINKIWLCFIIFSFYNVILFLRTPTIKGFYSFLLQVLLFFLASSLTSIRLDEEVMKNIFKWGRVLYFILLIPASLIAIEGGRMAFEKFNNYFSPVIYKIMLPCTFFFLPNSKHKPLKILFFSFIYFRMVERTSSIVLIIIYIMYLLLKKVKKSKTLYRLIFIGVFILIIVFSYIYVQLQYTKLGYVINDIFREHTGGNFFSGRNRIWEIAFNYIKEAPILGYGLDNGLMSSVGIEMSTHNTYIHILLQGGVIGLLMFFMFIYAIWESYFESLDDDIVVTGAAYFIGILIFINFEVTLIGNSVVTAIFLWFVLGITSIQCKNKKNNSINKIE